MSGVIKNSSLCIIYDLQTERMKRSNTSYYQSLTSPFLMEAMTDFLSENSIPMSREKLKEGLELMTEVYKKAHTEELRFVANDYIKMYSLHYNQG